MKNFDMAAFYSAFLENIRDAQGTDGSMTDFVPFCDEEDDDPIIACNRPYTRLCHSVSDTFRPADPAWGTAYPHILWYMFVEYGDFQLIADHYENIKNYISNLTGLAGSNGLLNFGPFGDWEAPFRCDNPLVSSFYYCIQNIEFRRLLILMILMFKLLQHLLMLLNFPAISNITVPLLLRLETIIMTPSLTPVLLPITLNKASRLPTFFLSLLKL